ncbi:MAG TPA: glycosyltransferase family 4 protein [Pyrinomonadaceae bacterium]|nr:glycosyltransferase family 4 protein [Pyrinomonadaceae bacterium]
MRVLHVHSGNLYGGVETLLATLWRERAACPSMETQFALCFEGRLSRELRDDGATVHALGVARVRSPLSVRRSRRALARLLRERAFDIAVCHSSWTQALFGPVVRAHGLPLVFWMHAPQSGTHWLERWARRTTPDLVVCNSRFTAGSLGKLYPRARAEVVYCPLSARATRLTTAERASLRAEFDTTASATVVLQAGRFERLKGHIVHLEALGLLREVPGWVCWQAGGAQRTQEEKYLNDLKSLASRLGIGDRVRFVGERSDVQRLMAAADIYCQPNVHPDSFGLTFAEALRAGLPVVTTGIGGALEVVDDSCGVLVPQGDARALASALRGLIERPSLLSTLGSSGPARAHLLCSPDNQMKRLSEVFARI